MKLTFGVVLGAVACLLLLGCDNSGKEPTGQVVATVNGDEITAIDLRNEMSGFQAPDAATRKAAERQALEQIIQRKLLVEAAQERKLDKTPEYVQQQQRITEAYLVRFWQDRVAKSVPPPSADEVARFVESNPDLYSAHKVLVLDQVRAPVVRDQALLDAMRPLKTLPEVTSLLAAKNIRFQQGVVEMDTLAVRPAVVAQILKLPPNEVFVVPQGNLMTINQIREVRVVPAPPQVATAHAKQLLLTERTQQAVQRELGAAMAAARKEEDAVKYAKAYQPAAKGAAPPAKK